MLFLQARGNVCMHEDLSLFSKCFSRSNSHNSLSLQVSGCFQKEHTDTSSVRSYCKRLDQCFPATKAKQGIECIFQSNKQRVKGRAGEHNSKHGMWRGLWESHPIPAASLADKYSRSQKWLILIWECRGQALTAQWKRQLLFQRAKRLFFSKQHIQCNFNLTGIIFQAWERKESVGDWLINVPLLIITVEGL